MYATLKLIHIGAAILTISGFVLRGYWMLAESSKLELRTVRVAPHIIDTVLLLSGISLVWALDLPVFSQPWLMAKLAALIVYVILGTVALRRGKTLRTRALAFVLALIAFAYIAGIALTKSMGSWLAL